MKRCCQAKTLDELYRNVAVWMTQNLRMGEFGDVFVWGRDLVATLPKTNMAPVNRPS